MGSRGYAAAYEQLESLAGTFDPPPPGGPNGVVGPVAPGYRPENSSRSTAASYGSTGMSNRRASGSTSNHTNRHQQFHNQQQYHHQPSHSLLMGLSGLSYHPTQPQHHQPQQHSMPYGGAGGYGHQHQTQQQQQYQHQRTQQRNSNYSASYTSHSQQHAHQPQRHQQQQQQPQHQLSPSVGSRHGGDLSPVAMLLGGGIGAGSAASANCSASRSNHNNSMHRISSFEEFFMLYPGILGAATGGAVSASAAATTDTGTPTMLSSCSGSGDRSPLLDPLPLVTSSSSHPYSFSVRGMPGYGNSSSNGGGSSDNIGSDQWLDELRIEVSGLSTEPMSGRQVLSKVRSSLEHVTQRYIPCVDFLVQCQQELRRGLNATASTGRSASNRTLTARQYYAMFVQKLPHRFHSKNQYFMEKQALQDAVHGIQQLVADAQRAERLGAEAVKNQFLGGMKDGQSWGLRKWMATHGNALTICTNIECVHQSVHKLERSAETTRKLTSILRPLAAETLKRLQSDIPKTYQAHSSAHPYLPFFHRLESALRSMSQYDPDDDDVICIDDSDDDEPEPVVSTTSKVPPASAPAASRKRPASGAPTAVTLNTSPIHKRPPAAPNPVPIRKKPREEITIDDDDDGSRNDDDGSSDDGSVVEVIEIVNNAEVNSTDEDGENKKQNPQEGNDYNVAAGWKCPSCSLLARSSSETCEHCGEVNFMKDLNFFGSVEALINGGMSGASSGSLTPPPQQLFRQLLDDDDDDSSLRSSKSPPLAPDDENDTKPKAKKAKKARKEAREVTTTQVLTRGWPIPLPEPNTVYASSLLMADTVDRVAALFDEGQQHFIRPHTAPFGQFWDGERYAAALKLFSNILRKTDACYFVDAIDDDRLNKAGHPPFSCVVRHPLCFRDIVAALVQDVEGGDGIVPLGRMGQLPVTSGLGAWNMWKGMDLLQAIDLVFLNSLAYGRAVDDAPATQRGSHRAKTNKLRKELWDGISRIVVEHVGTADVDRRRLCTPTRRAESSGFIVYK